MVEIKNRSASFNYKIEDSYEAGIVLKGTEIKSIKEGKANIKDSYAIIRKGECFLLNMHISAYKTGGVFNHEETRTRKLLLNKKEIFKIRDMIDMNGSTLIPLKLYFKKNKVKIELGLCKGKKNYDKRESLKEKSIKKDIQKALKSI